MISTDLNVEMYLKPVSTGVYDWVDISNKVRRANGVPISRGLEDLNSDPGPGRVSFATNDSAGDFVIDNPMSAYYPSVDLGVQIRLTFLNVDDACTRTETNTWGSVGNLAGDVWTNGTSSGGTVNATDWTVSSGTAKHSVPAAPGYRVSELSKAVRKPTNAEVLLTEIKVPVNSMSGTGGMRSEVWFRTVDVSNYHACALRFAADETLQIAFYEQVAGVTRYLLNYATIPGFTLAASHVDYNLRCQIEEGAMRAKVWETGTPEPMDWQVVASRAVVREGYIAVATFVETGNSNTKPLVMSYDRIAVRTPLYYGEMTKSEASGDDKSNVMVTKIEAADIFDRLQTGSAPVKSVMRRGRTTSRRWLLLNGAVVQGVDARTFTTTTAQAVDVVVGDFFFLFDSTGKLKEDTRFTVTSKASAAGTDTIGFTPDAREAPGASHQVDFYHLGTTTTQPIGYWPCEDGVSATQISSGLPGGAPMSITGSPKFASVSDFACSAPILEINDAELNANLPDYVDVNQAFSFTFLLRMPDTDEATPPVGTDLLQFYATGTGWSYDLRYTASGNGSFQLLVFNSASTLLFDSGQIDFGLRGDPCHVTLTFQQVGGAVNYTLFKTDTEGVVGGVGPATVTGVGTLGKITQIRINPAGGYKGVAFGHITAIPGVWDADSTYNDVVGWTNQPALRRMARLCDEENITLTYVDDWDVLSSRMGAQKIGRRADLFKDPAKVDAGFVAGPRGGLGLEVCTRGALLNQVARAQFSLSGGQILPAFDPVRDYSNIKNQYTVRRIDGTTAVAELTTGRLSTQDPPNGIGLRDDGDDLSLGNDNQAQDHADWRLALNTVRKHRVTSLKVTPAGVTSVGLDKLMGIGIGSRIDITSLASKKIFDDLPQLVLGYTLDVGDKFFPEMDLHCAPYEPYRAPALTSDQYSVPDAVDTTTGSTLTTTATGSLTLTSASTLYLWTTLASDFPLDVMITGERVTLSAIVDTGTPGVQTATISARSVNGVVKTHAVGEDVVIVDPNYHQFR